MVFPLQVLKNSKLDGCNNIIKVNNTNISDSIGLLNTKIPITKEDITLFL